jgi:hypothetical protein
MIFLYILKHLHHLVSNIMVGHLILSLYIIVTPLQVQHLQAIEMMGHIIDLFSLIYFVK